MSLCPSQNFNSCHGLCRRAIECNQRAYEADKQLLSVSPRHTIWTGYLQHNIEFCAWAAFYGANREAAFQAVRESEARLPPEKLESSKMLTEQLEAYTTLKAMCLVRFGCWDDLLDLKPRSKPEVHLMFNLVSFIISHRIHPTPKITAYI